MLLMKIFASLAGLLHILFFVMESLLWLRPAVHQRFLVETLQEAETLQFALFNQGFYNLFLALGTLVGVVLASRNPSAGLSLIIFTCLFMIGAALVLAFSEPQLIRSALIQGLPPLLALLSYLIFR